MRKLLTRLRRSFSARLSLWVVLFAALVLLSALSYSSLAGRRSVKEEAILTATQVLENTSLRLSHILEGVQTSADNLEWLVYRHLDEPELMMDYSRSTVQSNPFLNGCSISFEPDYFKGHHYYSAYSGYVGDVLRTEQEGDDDYQYFYLGWYQLPKLLGQPCWTEPYNDWEQDDTVDRQTQMQVSYCKPLTDAEGTFIGAISLDISLQWLSETLSSIKPYPNAFCMLISRGGSYLVHPDSERLFYSTIFTDGLVTPNPELDGLGRAMQDLSEGYRIVDVHGSRSYVFFMPLKTTGWSLGIVCPVRDIFSGFNRLRQISLLLILLGLLLMFVVCFRVIGHAVKPLSDLAVQAEVIASGHFDTVLPESTRPDEIGVLSRSFGHMQDSLVSYMDELTRTTAERAQIEGELKIARNIQMGMVPRTFPPFPDREDIDLYASMTPARDVGGDLYDYFIQGGKLYFCVGDVSGKGIPASLFMAVACNLFRVMGKRELPPVEIAHEINDILSEGNEQLMFVTMFIGAIDLQTGEMDFCNCGHNPPVLLGPDGPRFLDCKPNTSIGIFSGWTFEGEHLSGLPGTPLFLFTDGLNEAENLRQEQFGNDRLLAVLSDPYEGAEATIRRMHAAVSRHVGEAEASDDLTMLCVEIKKKEA